MANYHRAGIEEVEELAQEVIKEDLPKLANINIGYQFREEHRMSKGRPMFVEPSKIPSKLENFIEENLIIIVPEDLWEACGDRESKKGMLHDGFCKIHLEEKEAADGFPRRTADDYYLLSNGKRVKGQKKAHEEQRKICDYDIKLRDHDVKVNLDNYDKYGAWKEEAKKMEQAVRQTNIFSRTAGE